MSLLNLVLGLCWITFGPSKSLLIWPPPPPSLFSMQIKYLQHGARSREMSDKIPLLRFDLRFLNDIDKWEVSLNWLCKMTFLVKFKLKSFENFAWVRDACRCLLLTWCEHVSHGRSRNCLTYIFKRPVTGPFLTSHIVPKNPCNLSFNLQVFN